jgi:hypothetical protein
MRTAVDHNATLYREVALRSARENIQQSGLACNIQISNDRYHVIATVANGRLVSSFRIYDTDRRDTARFTLLQMARACMRAQIPGDESF